jgi:hypothetical protein
VNDLDIIQRKNTESIERTIPDQLAKGKWAVAEYAGLIFRDAQFFDTEVEAARHACVVGLRVGQRARVYPPAGWATVDHSARELEGLMAVADSPACEIRRIPKGANASYGGTDSD